MGRAWMGSPAATRRALRSLLPALVYFAACPATPPAGGRSGSSCALAIRQRPRPDAKLAATLLGLRVPVSPSGLYYPREGVGEASDASRALPAEASRQPLRRRFERRERLPYDDAVRYLSHFRSHHSSTPPLRPSEAKQGCPIYRIRLPPTQCCPTPAAAPRSHGLLRHAELCEMGHTRMLVG